MKLNILVFVIFLLAGSVYTAAAICTDADHDGYAVEGGLCGAVDCDDSDPSVMPGAGEVCDGKDTDCDGWKPPTDVDSDGDGVPLCASDCNDGNAQVYPGAPELCDGLDNDCNGLDDSLDNACNLGDGLVGYWTMDAADITGSTIMDQSGYGNNGILHGTESVGGQIHEARSFNIDGRYAGADDYIEIADNAVLDLTGGEFTISAWIRANNYGEAANGRIIDHGGGSGGSGGWSLLLFDDGGLGSYALYTRRGSSTTISLSAQNSVVTGIWQHVVVTMSGGSVRFYVQGTENNVVLGVSNPTGRNGTIRIGLRATDIFREFDGLIDEVRIYNRALTGVEVSSLFNAGACTDNDNDEYAIQGGQCGAVDCNDHDGEVYPGAVEKPYDGIDQNCSGADLVDMDDDGYASSLAGGTDCDDSNAMINPISIWYYDSDGDGYGGTSVSLQQCSKPSGFTMSNTDCDDEDSRIYPGAEERCDGRDTDCDSIIPSLEYDHDNDGYSVCAGDCDDRDNTVFPTNSSLCTLSDSTCNGAVRVSWEAPGTNSDGSAITDLAGYTVYYGPAPSTFTWSLDVGNELCHGISRLPQGQWCFAVAAYDFSGNESEFSNRACKEIY